MQNNDFHAGLRVAFVDGHGTELRVDLYGGDEALCGSVLFEFENRAQRVRYHETVALWRDTNTELNLHYANGEATLSVESATLDLR